MRRVRFLIAVVAAAMVSVPAANAGLLDPVTQLVLPTCGSTTYPFAQFGDRYPYYAFSNNGFEAGSTGWSLAGGAYVGSGNEPWYVGGAGSRSLVLPKGATATSPGFCINLLDPVVRMFAHGTAGSSLQVQVIFRGLSGNLTGILDVSNETGTGAWTPTGLFNSQLALPLLTSYAQIRITAVSGSWQVDDAYVDPSVGRIG